MRDIESLADLWARRVEDPELARDLAGMRRKSSEDLADAFYRDLSFGTAGLRGILGVGTNRMNVYTVGRATQGLARYLNERFDAPSVAIARDSRNGGEAFVRRIAGVLAANGIRALVFPRIEPTPTLSFAVRRLGCSAGINVTASHNPAAYNGYKVYGADGCQIASQTASDISAAIDAVDPFDDVRCMDLDDAVRAGLVSWIDDAVVDAFIDAVAAQSVSDARGPLSVVYTPLNGTGLECVSRILARIGVSDVTLVEEQAVPDGDFPTCPYPNPETREALERGLALCEETGADLLIATDPDADRVGVAVRHQGAYRLISGNEMGILLLDYLARARRDAQGGLDGCVAVTTIVSTSMVDALARAYGFELRRTLTGFKYIGRQIGLLEAAGRASDFLFGFEESYGYLAGTHVRDKDAVVASMLICEMARDCRAQGRTLIDALDGLYSRFGHVLNRTISVEFPGADGAAMMRRIMEGLRASAPTRLGGLAVEKIVDYAAGAPMPVVGGASCGAACGREGEDHDFGHQVLPAADVIELRLEAGCKVIVRPSGTEPKVKAYVFAAAPTQGEAQALLERLDSAARMLLA
ncbi:phosphoglucomutase/phosphomannomutase, alpha/beta/alpha domain I [Slackia sp. CM382]|uniref:phospho-sugar mutase n=1 Tax=Slackia sp. CM382 TaxID=1111137 RepID=UPI00027C662A|nr:phospho-sugar mutase [Slackia sp. CM382]EJU35255.1 phosphoglucomutase/phosphomannomutase, alpha/beta/alpha domain I [Slackia sp. CM382]